MKTRILKINTRAEANSLVVKNLYAGLPQREILKGISLTINPGEVHALMGPNGSGKSTLSNVLAGHPQYQINSGEVYLGKHSILKLSPDSRARAGLFLAFQYPVEVTGVGLLSFLKTAYTSLHGNIDFKKFSEMVEASAENLHLNKTFLKRSLNEGFSGGEKKKAEILQLSVLRPKIAVLDETDSGLDIDSLKVVAQGINSIKEDSSARGSEVGILLITHYFRILKYVKPDFVHILFNGMIVAEGGPKLAEELEEKGYEWITKIKN